MNSPAVNTRVAKHGAVWSRVGASVVNATGNEGVLRMGVS
jgi:hypothetical protein